MPRRTRNLLAVLFTVAIGFMVLFRGRTTATTPERYLLIHTDDAGFCTAVNEGTQEGMERGIVSSTSILVCAPGFEEFARYAVAHPEYDYGVHLNLTAERSEVRWGPVLKDEVPSLRQKDGSFWQTVQEVAAHAKVEEVGRELRAQIKRAQDRGIPISHLDHHMWVLLLRPDLLRLYVELGLEYKLPIRLHRTHTPAECGPALQNAAEYTEIIRPIAAQGCPLIDFIDTDNYSVSPNQKRNYYLSKLRQLKPGISEFVIHCSVNRPGMVLPGAADRRAADTQAFTSREIQNEIQRLGIRVVSWKDLMKLQREKNAD